MWIIILAIIAAAFFWMWRFAGRIEDEAEEEQQWKAWVERMKWQDPYNAWRYEQMFEERFYK